MNRFIRYFARFAMIAIGYTAASLAASLFMNIVMAGLPGQEFIADPALFLSVAVGALFIGYFAFIPAMVAILIGEITSKRDWLFYVFGGAVCAAMVLTLFWAGEQAGGDDPEFALIMMASGISGSWIYWLIAGRNAGAWRD